MVTNLDPHTGLILIKIPLAYAPRARFVQRLNQTYDATEVQTTLPRMSFEWTDISYDSTRKLNTMQKMGSVYITLIFTVAPSGSFTIGEKITAIFVIVSSINLPIIKFSVDWWNTLHQPASISKLSAPSIDSSMLSSLIIMTMEILMKIDKKYFKFIIFRNYINTVIMTYNSYHNRYSY